MLSVTCWNCLYQHVATTYDAEKIRKTILKLKTYQVSFMPIVLISLQHVKLPINVKIPDTLWQIVYFT